MDFLDTAVQFEEKAFGDAGSFEGYAAIFGNVDLGGDVIERGSFKQMAKNSDGKIVVLNQHNRKDPIGVAEVAEDTKGLHFRGSLVLEVPSARSAYALMRAKALTGMSIGYDVLPGGAEVTNTGVRKLKGMKLWEISPVTFGMNPLAGISDVKAVLTNGALPSLAQFEEFLREAGFSRTQAKAIAGSGLSQLLRREVGSDPVADVVRTSLAVLRGETP